jgi:hypothetical protein
MGEKQNEQSEVEKQLQILTNLKTVLLGTKFIPSEFQAAVDMLQFVDSLESQAKAAAGLPSVEPEAPAPAAP